MFVKPAPHPEIPEALLKVRHPRTHAFMKDDGEEVPENRFWLRRLSQGDVVKVEAKAEEPAATTAAHEGEPA